MQVLALSCLAGSMNASLAVSAVVILWAAPSASWLALMPPVILFLAYRAYVSQRHERAKTRIAVRGDPVVASDPPNRGRPRGRLPGRNPDARGGIRRNPALLRTEPFGDLLDGSRTTGPVERYAARRPAPGSLGTVGRKSVEQRFSLPAMHPPSVSRLPSVDRSKKLSSHP